MDSREAIKLIVGQQEQSTRCGKIDEIILKLYYFMGSREN